MLNVTDVLKSAVVDRATAHRRALFGDAATAELALVERAADIALDAISGSDALYHNVEHTTHVTLVGLELLLARHDAAGDVTPRDWANTVVALLCHDIGYVRGLCRSDNGATLASGSDGAAFKPVPGASDAMLMPVHVNRGKRYVEETFLTDAIADVGFINACIERTRFPVPDDPWYWQTADFPGLVRAADLIGQLSDPRYLHKLTAIFYEFEEIGFNKLTGYERPGDLLTGYPDFFEKCVRPYVGDACAWLERTEEGRDILAHLDANLSAAREALAAPRRAAANG